jgi:5-methylcytosine-specific restriction endonuclease McrA
VKKPKSFSPAKSTGNKVFKKKRLYDDVSWTELRNKFLALNPRCYACGDPARVVDHVVGHKGDEIKFWDVTNMIPLCKSDHDYITATFDRHSVPKTEEKMRWIANKRLETDTTVKVKILNGVGNGK